jgi:hypothetical protein
VNRFIIYTEDGEITGIKIGSQPSDCLFIKSAEPIENKYIADGNLVDIPSKPSNWHEFDYSIKEWIDTKTNVEKTDQVISEARITRSRLLLASDWTQMPDAPITETQRAEWAAYRQALRDVPQHNQSATSIDDIIWPTKPE